MSNYDYYNQQPNYHEGQYYHQNQYYPQQYPPQTQYNQQQSYYPQQYSSQNYGEFQPTNQKGLLADAASATIGGFAGSKLGGQHNILGGIAGAIAGAIIAHQAEKAYEHHHHHHHHNHNGWGNSRW